MSAPDELIDRAAEPLRQQLHHLYAERTIRQLAHEVLAAVTVDPVAEEADGELRIVWPAYDRGWVMISPEVLDGLVGEINKLRAQLRDAAALEAASHATDEEAARS